MLTYEDLSNAKPDTWLEAGDEWLAIANSNLAQAYQLRDTVVNPLSRAWPDAAGQQAASHIKSQVDLLLIASMECRSVSMMCRGLGHALALARHVLDHANQLANDAGLRIDDDGVVHFPAGQRSRDLIDEQRSVASTVRDLIAHALTTASQADEKARTGLEKLSQAVTETDVTRAESSNMGSASRIEVQMLIDSIPHGSAADNATWWDALTADDRQILMSTAPGTLDALAGIPSQVKDQLHGTSKYDRAKVAQWAIDHWNDTSDDPFDDNCTNFASNALEGGGMRQKDDFWLGTLSSNSWDKSIQTGWAAADEHDYTHSPSWAQAPAFYHFMTTHGGQEISMQEARPGDILVWEDDTGKQHHAAVVTAVVDGDIRYTQHSGEQLDASLSGREPVFEQGSGQLAGAGAQKLHVIRPNPDWY